MAKPIPNLDNTGTHKGKTIDPSFQMEIWVKVFV